MRQLFFLLSFYALSIQTNIYKKLSPFFMPIALILSLILASYCAFIVYHWSGSLSHGNWFYLIFISQSGVIGQLFVGFFAGCMALANCFVLFVLFYYFTNEIQQKSIDKIPKIKEQSEAAKQEAYIKAESARLEQQLVSFTNNNSAIFTNQAHKAKKKIHKI